MATRRRITRLALAALLITAPTLFSQPAPPSAPQPRRTAVRYTVRERVEFLHNDQWHLATILAWESGQLRIRTDADNAEHVVSPVQLRKFTRARNYPIKAAPQDIAAIEAALAPPPKPADPNAPANDLPLRPGVQPAEPDPVDMKPADPAPDPSPDPQSEIRTPQSTLPLPPAPNPLPRDVPTGNLAAATPLAPPEKVATLAPYTPDPAPALKKTLHPTPIPLRPLDTRDAVFQEPAPLLFTSPEFAQAFVPHRERSMEADSDLYYDRYDLSTGQRTGGFAVPPSARVLDLSPDGTRLLLSWTANPDDPTSVQHDTLGVFVITNDRLTLRAAFRPYASLRSQLSTGIATARFLSTNTQLLTSTGSDLTAWDLDANRATYRLFPITPCTPALSASRKHVAIVSNSTPWLLDAATGQPTLKIPATLPPGTTGPLFLSPDQSHLACLLEDRLFTWPLNPPPENPQSEVRDPQSDTTLPLPTPATHLDWLSETYALVNHRYLIHLPLQLPLWDYRPAEPEPNGVAGTFANHFYYSTPSQSGGPRLLARTTLPHQPALDAAANINPDTLMAIKPGAQVSIDLSQVEADDLFRSRTHAALTAKLQQTNGLVVTDNAPIRLVVTSTAGEFREITYRSPTTGDATTIEIPEDHVTLSFVQGTQVLWKTTRPATPPGALALRPGQSPEDYLHTERARLRLATATAVTIPKFIPHPRPTPFHGTSPLTESGPQPSP